MYTQYLLDAGYPDIVFHGNFYVDFKTWQFLTQKLRQKLTWPPWHGLSPMKWG